MMKTITQFMLSMLLLCGAAGPVHSSGVAGLPELFKNSIPVNLKDGLKLVEVKKRCEDCAPWRLVDFRDNKSPQPFKQEKVSVQAGYTAMYAFPGTEYFANTKIEQSAPGSYDKDRAVVIDAIRTEYARKKELVAGYLRDNPKVRERVDSLLPKDKEAIEFEAGSYKGVEYVSYTENVIGLTGATISQLHFFVPKRELIITAYLLKQKKSRFTTSAEFLALRRDFIEAYIDFLSAE